MTEFPHPRRSTYAGLFLVTLATLMHEILLTRIFSVALYYHFAFMAISVAMFGMTAGAIYVYLRPDTFRPERAPRQLTVNALAYALTLVVCCVLFLQLPLRSMPEITLENLGLWALGYFIIAVPFTFSGVTVALALTKFPAHVNRLYAADLVGAASGCFLLIWSLEVSGGATALIVVAAVSSLGATFFSLGLLERGLRRASVGVTLALGVAAVGHGVLERQNRPIIEITDVMDSPVESLHFVRWNSHSRVSVHGNPFNEQVATGWGLSAKTHADEAKTRHLFMSIDTFASTAITHFDGDTTAHWYLKDDVTNMAHHIRKNADVVVVGVGGGRDVLSALTFDQRSVLGIEINQNILDALTVVYADFSGRLGEHPRVKLVHDEARSHLTRSSDRFDIIQLSLIDTFAATAAGAFVLSENALYTVEAWQTFLERLKPNGILTVSRWFYPGRPAEAIRLASLAREALARMGVGEPHRRVVFVKAKKASGLAGELGSGIANILVSRDPFSPEDIRVLRREADRLGFDILTSPEGTEEPGLQAILWSDDPAAFYESYPLDLSAPTDDRPFFFHMLRFSDFGDSLAANFLDPNQGQLKAVRMLFGLLIVVVVLTALCIVVPLALGTRKGVLRGNGSLLLFFFAVGLGFMFVEMSQMQRLMVMLGHPTYALSVVLFTLLAGTGIGSYLSARVRDESRFGPRAALGSLVVVLVLFGLVTPALVRLLSGATTPVRIAVASMTLFVAGLLLGLPFPLGMRRAWQRAGGELTPWLWGVNGAASVLCTVVAAAVALSLGISASFWAGVVCYVVAFFALPRTAAVSAPVSPPGGRRPQTRPVAAAAGSVEPANDPAAA